MSGRKTLTDSVVRVARRRVLDIINCGTGYTTSTQLFQKSEGRGSIQILVFPAGTEIPVDKPDPAVRSSGTDGDRR
jgi:hypothetical protein